MADENAPVERNGGIEWPTLLLILAVYALWIYLLSVYETAGAWLIAPILVYLLTLHSSLCHEVLHGHPTRIRWFNDLLVQIPLALMVPYFTFRESHLAHHQDDIITLPHEDPESFYVTRAEWESYGAMARHIATFKMTFAGRALLDPGIKFMQMLAAVVRDIGNGRWDRVARYAAHFLLSALVVLLVNRHFQVAIWQYLLIAYLSNSLLQLRSFYEHRPRQNETERTVIVESGPLLQLLFLNNNYHYVHHRHPQMAWYRIPGEYRRNREEYLAANGGFHFHGYRYWLKYLLRPVDRPVHPFA